MIGFFALAAPALAGTAQIQLSSGSIKMNPGSCSCGFGLVWKLHFSTYATDDPSEANGEIAPRPPGSGTTRRSVMILEDPSMWSAITFADIWGCIHSAAGGRAEEKRQPIMMEIAGGVPGLSYEVQSTTSLTAPSWKTETTILNTDTPSAVALALPASGTQFWRVRVSTPLPPPPH